MRISCSAYHAYASGKSYAMSAPKARLAEQVKETFYLHRRRYGARRIAAELRAEGRERRALFGADIDEAAEVASYPSASVCAAHDRIQDIV